jgi:deoxycytidylate deaminase
MRKPEDPRELAIAIASRSTCAVQVGAVLADKHGIFAWGHNHMGSNGLGMHAEAHAFSRANPRRLKNATLYVAALRRKSKSTVTARPCEDCQRFVRACAQTFYRDRLGWIWLRT